MPIREVAEKIAGVSSVKQSVRPIALVKELGFAFSINVVLHRANLSTGSGRSSIWRRVSEPTVWSWPTRSITAGVSEPRAAHADT